MSTVKTLVEKNIKRGRPYAFSAMPTFSYIVFDDENISFHLSDKRIISIPISWVPKLEQAPKTVRENYTLRGHFVFWESIDEIIGVKNLINGTIVPL
jgi:hypothetical protein